MSRTIILTEGQYAVLATAGAACGQTPEGILAQWIEAVRLCNHVLSPDVSRMYRMEWMEQIERVRRVERLKRVEDDPNATQPSTDHRVVASTRVDK
jgi:hypothetical protein